MNGIKTERPLLSICIPTYNRPNSIKDRLEKIAVITESNNIKILISDNSENDETEEIVDSFSQKYSNIVYFKQLKNVGSDLNTINTFKMCDSDYYLVLGDRALIDWDLFQGVLTELSQNKFDLYVLNRDPCIKNFPPKNYDSVQDLIIEMGWHMTYIASLIISYQIAHSESYIRYINTSFIHWGIIFEELALKSKINVRWNNERIIIRMNDYIDNHWYPKQACEILFKRWPQIVYSLPSSIDFEIKKKVARSHAVHTGILLPKNMCYLNAAGLFSYSDYCKYRKYIKYASPYPQIMYFLISLIPSSMSPFPFLYRVLRKIKPLKK